MAYPRLLWFESKIRTLRRSRNLPDHRLNISASWYVPRSHRHKASGFGRTIIGPFMYSSKSKARVSRLYCNNGMIADRCNSYSTRTNLNKTIDLSRLDLVDWTVSCPSPSKPNPNNSPTLKRLAIEHHPLPHLLRLPLPLRHATPF